MRSAYTCSGISDPKRNCARLSVSDQAVESNIGDINGINRSYNFFVSMRWRPDFSR